jgi:hypothetical protein
MAALSLLALGFAAGANAAPQIKLPVASPVLNVAVAPLAPAILPPLSLGATTQLGVFIFSSTFRKASSHLL